MRNGKTWIAAMLRNFLFSSGLFLTAATQLRIPGVPVGPGEFLLVCWVGLGMLLGPPCAKGIHRGANAVAIFWALFAISLGVGMVMSFANELFFDTASVIHDMIAYSFGLTISAMLVRDLAVASRRRRIVWLILSISTCGLLIQVLEGAGLFGLPGIEPWYWNRFQGWSDNPNMLGLLSAFVVLLAVFGLDIATSRRETILASVACALALLTGFMTRSDSFTLSILVGGSLWLGVKMWSGLLARRSSAGPTVGVVCLFSAPLIFAAAIPFAPAAIGAAGAYTTNMYEDNSQGETRFNLWREAVEKGLESALVGYGPGPHLTSKSFKRPPPDKFEAHNTFLDIFTQGGLLGVLAFIWLLGATFAVTIRAGLIPLVALACGLLIFSLFHFVVRQPIFWFGLVLCLVEADAILRQRRSAFSRGGPLQANVVCR